MFGILSNSKMRMAINTEGENAERAHHDVIAGNAAYPPVAMRNVPKYFTPMDTSAMFTENPATQSRRPAATKGERILMASAQTDHATTFTAGKWIYNG